MNREHSGKHRRHLAVWFPLLPTDRVRSSEAVNGRLPERESGQPRVLFAKDKGALRIVASDEHALAMGLTPGMSLADARARAPELDARPHDHEADAKLVQALLEDFGRFTPMIAADEPHGLMLDITGCAHLFGGEEGMAKAVRARARRYGLNIRLAIARTPDGARALARHGKGGITEQGRDHDQMQHLPVEAMEIGGRDIQALRRAGLRTLHDLDRRPRVSMAARFGADFPDRLDRIMGRSDVRITPHRVPAPVAADRILSQPVTELEGVQVLIAELAADVARQLETRVEGARRYELTLFRVDGFVRRICVQTARYVRDPVMVARLYRERLAALSQPLDAGFGFDHLRMTADSLRRLTPQQCTLLEQRDAHSAMDDLIDTLCARLGPDAVVRTVPFASHVPERAWRTIPAQAQRLQNEPWPEQDDASPPLRPLLIFDPPHLVEAMALAPDSPPVLFRWRRVTRRITRAEGPERIAAEWWRAPSHRVRDYYRVEDEEGLRFWLFRAGEYGAEPPPRWYVHGLFA